MKIVFMGTAAFAVPTLEALHKSDHDIAVVVSQPDKPAGRGKHMHSPPVAAKAKDLELPLYQPRSVRSQKVIDKILVHKPDIIVVVAYGKILPNEILEAAPFGCVNVHSSLLPKYRGAAPINWAVVNGEEESGVTTMYISEELDAGDILLKSTTKIDPDENAITLHDRLAPMGADLLIETLEKLEKKKISPIKQDHKEATFAPIIKKEDGHIDWKKGSSEIRDLIRGMQPWPTGFSFIEGKFIRFFDTKPTDIKSTLTPGTITLEKHEMRVSTGDNDLSIHELQIEGKRKMTVVDFINGHKNLNGKTLE